MTEQELIDKYFPPRNCPCGYCGGQYGVDVRYISGVDYPICQPCRHRRGQEPLIGLLGPQHLKELDL